jgi:hypothetical protein
VSGEQTEGRLLQVRSTDWRGAAPPLHIHHDADETWYVIDGQLTVFVGDERIEAGPGDFVFGPMGVPHAFLVTSERAESLITFSPAGTQGPSGYGVDGFFREAAVPVVPGQAPPEPTQPDPEELARRMARYGIEMVGAAADSRLTDGRFGRQTTEKKNGGRCRKRVGVRVSGHGER